MPPITRLVSEGAAWALDKLAPRTFACGMPDATLRQLAEHLERHGGLIGFAAEGVLQHEKHIALWPAYEADAACWEDPAVIYATLPTAQWPKARMRRAFVRAIREPDSVPVVTCLSASLWALSDRLFEPGSSDALLQEALLHPELRIWANTIWDVGSVPVAHAVSMSRNARFPSLADGFTARELEDFVSSRWVRVGLTCPSPGGSGNPERYIQNLDAFNAGLTKPKHARTRMIASMHSLEKHTRGRYQFVDTAKTASAAVDTGAEKPLVDETWTGPMFAKAFVDAVVNGVATAEFIDFYRTHDLFARANFRHGDTSRPGTDSALLGLRDLLWTHILGDEHDDAGLEKNGIAWTRFRNPSEVAEARVHDLVSKLVSSGVAASECVAVRFLVDVTVSHYTALPAADVEPLMAVFRALDSYSTELVDGSKQSALRDGIFPADANGFTRDPRFQRGMERHSTNWALANHMFVTEKNMRETIERALSGAAVRSSPSVQRRRMGV
jgi:hypothetical protein